MNIIVKDHNPFLCHLSLGNTEMLSNRPSQLAHLCGIKPPCRRAQEIREDKQRKLTF